MIKTASSNVTSKGQLTLPKAMRDQLGIQPGDRLMLFLENGVLNIRPTKEVVNSLIGSLKPKGIIPVYNKKIIREAMAKAAVKRYKRSLNS